MKTYSDSGMMGVALLVLVLLHVCRKEKGGYLMAASSFLVMAIPAYSLGQTFFEDSKEMKTTKIDLFLKSNL